MRACMPASPSLLGVPPLLPDRLRMGRMCGSLRIAPDPLIRKPPPLMHGAWRQVEGANSLGFVAFVCALMQLAASKVR